MKWLRTIVKLTATWFNIVERAKCKVTGERPWKVDMSRAMFGTWHHQVVRDGDDYYFYEVWRGKDGKIVGGYEATLPRGSGIDSLRTELGWLLAALDKPVLDCADIPKEETNGG